MEWDYDGGRKEEKKLEEEDHVNVKSCEDLASKKKKKKKKKDKIWMQNCVHYNEE